MSNPNDVVVEHECGRYSASEIAAAAKVEPPKPIRKHVAVDLDGVLAQYDHWRGIEHIGDPIPGAQEFCRKLSEFADVLIHTTRLSPDVNKGVPQQVLADIVIAWLKKHGFPPCGLWVGPGKPIAAAYVDDRAVWIKPQEVDAANEYGSAIDCCRQLCDTAVKVDSNLEVAK